MRTRNFAKTLLSMSIAAFVVTSLNLSAVEVLLERVLHNDAHEVELEHHAGHTHEHRHHNENETNHSQDDHSHGFECYPSFIFAQSSEVTTKFEILPQFVSFTANERISEDTTKAVSPRSSTGPPDFERLLTSLSISPTGPPLV